MQLLFYIALFSFSVQLAFAQTRSTADDEPIPTEPDDPEKDAADLELAKKTATQFAADVMNIRQTEDIHGLTNWLLPTVTFQLCKFRLFHGHLMSYITHSLLDQEKYPTAWEIDVAEAYTRDDILSMYANTKGFVFEDGDKIILDFKKQEDGSYKMSHGTILTCRYE